MPLFSTNDSSDKPGSTPAEIRPPPLVVKPMRLRVHPAPSDSTVVPVMGRRVGFALTRKTCDSLYITAVSDYIKSY